MAEELRIADRPSLHSPVLISAFRGWNDGGQGASLAGGYLAKTWEAERFAEVEPESFYDFQATRPHVSLVEGQTRHIEWPENAFYHASIPGLERDAVLLLGIEPNLRWRTFTGMVVDLARDLGIELMITLGELEEASDRYSEQVSEAVASDDETAAYVEELEQRAEMLDDDQEIPSGDSLAAELTRFLREREHDDESDRGPSEQP